MSARDLHPEGGPNNITGSACSETPAPCLEGEDSQQTQRNGGRPPHCEGDRTHGLGELNGGSSDNKCQDLAGSTGPKKGNKARALPNAT